MPDAHANFAYSTVATAPSPASSGTSLVVASGDGAKFPAVPFNATVWPASSQPTSANAEIVRVTARSTDTLTITRAQESSSARTVVVGDQIAATVTAKTLTDIETAVFTPSYFSGDYIWPPVTTLANANPPQNSLSYHWMPIYRSFTAASIACRVEGTAGTGSTARLGIYNDNGGRPGSRLIDAGTVVLTSGGDQLKTINQALTPGVYWMALQYNWLVSAGAFKGFSLFIAWPGQKDAGNGARQGFWEASGTGTLPGNAATGASLNSHTAQCPMLSLVAA